MKLPQALILLFSLTLISCANPKTDERPSEELTIYVYASKISGDTTYCYVDFRDPANGNGYYVLEADDIVACDGMATSPSSGGWSVQFNHPGVDPVRVTIVRPGAGTILVKYADLQ